MSSVQIKIVENTITTLRKIQHELMLEHHYPLDEYYKFHYYSKLCDCFYRVSRSTNPDNLDKDLIAIIMDDKERSDDDGEDDKHLLQFESFLQNSFNKVCYYKINKDIVVQKC